MLLQSDFADDLSVVLPMKYRRAYNRHICLMKELEMKMKLNKQMLGLVLVVTAIMHGCASSRVEGVKPVSLLMLTPLETDATHRYIFPEALAAGKPVVVALINVDFSKTYILFDFSVGVFEPRVNKGNVYLKTKGAEEPLVSLAEVRAKLESHIDGQPVGIIMSLDGVPLGVDEHAPKPEQGEFFRDFETMMADAGIAFAYIVPEKLVVSR